MRRVTLALLGITAVAASALTIPVAHAAVAPKSRAVAPTAADLLARTGSCSVASKSRYRTDSEAGATVNICASGSAFFWKADMDIDCDGVTTSVCNSSTDPWYQAQTSFRTSTN